MQRTNSNSHLHLTLLLNRAQDGELNVVGNNNIEHVADKEFGVEGVITENTYLYETQAGVGHDREAADHLAGTSSARVYSSGDGLQFKVAGELKKGQKIVYRVIKRKSDRQIICEAQTIEDNIQRDDSMPETGYGAKVGAYGFIDVKKVERDNLHVDYFRTIPLDAHLFSRDTDLKSEVNQKYISNCYFLAAVLAVLQQDPEGGLIKRIMRKEGQYTYVRLYSPESFREITYRLENSIYYRHDTTPANAVMKRITNKDTASIDRMSDHKGMWMHLLEKAFVVSARAQSGLNENRYEFAFPAYRTMYGNGGVPELALSILTGVKAQSIELADFCCSLLTGEVLYYCAVLFEKHSNILKQLDIPGLDKALMCLPEKDLMALKSRLGQGDSDDKIIEILAETFKTNLFNGMMLDDNKKRLLKQFVFDCIGCLTGEYKAFFKYVGGIKKAVEIVAEIDRSKLRVQQQQADVTKLYHCKPAMTGAEIDKLFDLVKKDHLDYPYDAKARFKNNLLTILYKDIENADFGINRYSFHELMCYCALKKIMGSDDKKSAVVVGTNHEIDESVRIGLRPKHAYALESIYLEPDSALIYIKIRNPWGYKGRIDKWDPKQTKVVSEETEDAVSTIELKTFLSLFHYMSYSDLSRLKPQAVPTQQLARSLASLTSYAARRQYPGTVFNEIVKTIPEKNKSDVQQDLPRIRVNIDP